MGPFDELPAERTAAAPVLPILERTSVGEVVNARSPRGQKRELSPRLMSRILSSPGMLYRSLSAGNAGGASASRALVGVAAAKVAKSLPIHAGSQPAIAMRDHVDLLAGKSASAGGSGKKAALTDLMHAAGKCTGAKMPAAAAAAAAAVPTPAAPSPAPAAAAAAAGSNNASGSAPSGSASKAPKQHSGAKKQPPQAALSAPCLAEDPEARRAER
jgi:hypothetical protein